MRDVLLRTATGTDPGPKASWTSRHRTMAQPSLSDMNPILIWLESEVEIAVPGSSFPSILKGVF
jgi:hypothetical protein